MRTVILFFFFFSQLSSAKEIWISDWEFKEQRDGITAECRTHISHIDQCLYRTVVDVPIAELVAVQMDHENYKSWFANVTVSKYIDKQSDPDSAIVYLRFNFRGIVADRYTVLLSEFGRDPATGVVTHTFQRTKSNYKEPDLRLVEYPVMIGYFKFTPGGNNGETEIEYTNLSPPGEQLQNYLYMLYNIENLKAGFTSILGLIRVARQQEYQHKVELDTLPTVKHALGVTAR